MQCMLTQGPLCPKWSLSADNIRRCQRIILSSTNSSAPDLLTEDLGRLPKQASPEAAGLKEISQLWDHLLQLNGECAVRNSMHQNFTFKTSKLTLFSTGPHVLPASNTLF